MTFILGLVHLTKKGLNTLVCFNYIARRASLILVCMWQGWRGQVFCVGLVVRYHTGSLYGSTAGPPESILL